MKINRFTFWTIFFLLAGVLLFSLLVLIPFHAYGLVSFTFVLILVLACSLMSIIVYDKLNTRRLKRSLGSFIQQIKQGNFESSKSQIIRKYDFVNLTDIQIELSQIVGQIQSDYKEQNRYIENVSHELMTPIAIIRGKLELLIQSQNIKKSDFSLINDVMLKLERLAKVNQSLVLLSKIDHNQYPLKEDVSLNDIIDEILNLFEDQIRIDELTIRKRVDAELKAEINETLAYLLMKNIIKNAVIHNIEKGFINILIEQDHIYIKNSGSILSSTTEKLFERFEVEKESEESIGLGLSIIKKICEVSEINLSYVHQNGEHQISLRF